jgi:hypothetical protein
MPNEDSMYRDEARIATRCWVIGYLYYKRLNVSFDEFLASPKLRAEFDRWHREASMQDLVAISRAMLACSKTSN